MSALAAQQRALAALLTREGSIAEDAEATALAAGNARLSPGAQVEIYREQFFLRHEGALREDFGALARFLGDAAFAALARAYLAAHPPRSFSLRDLGEALPAFVTAGAARDLALVEWAFVEVFDAPSLPPLTTADLASVAPAEWPMVRLALQPYVKLLSLAHAAHDYRLATRRGEHVDLTARASFVAVYRGPESLHCLDLEPAAYALLDALRGASPLGEACEIAAKLSPTFEADLGAWFQQWTALGFLSAPHPPCRTSSGGS